jgi:hypothetical protein
VTLLVVCQLQPYNSDLPYSNGLRKCSDTCVKQLENSTLTYFKRIKGAMMKYKTTNFIKRPHSAIIGALLATTLLGACQTTNRYGSDYANDVCKVQRDALQDTGNKFSGEMVVGAIKGVVGGALIGAVVAAKTDGNIAKGIAIGAVAGGLTGFGAGYFNALAKEKGDDPTGLLALFQNDLKRDTEQIAKTQKAFDALIDCRRNEIDGVKKAVKSGKMPSKEGQAKMLEIRDKLTEDTRVAKEIQGNLQDRTAQYAVAGAKLGVPGANGKANAAFNKNGKPGATKPDLTPVAGGKAPEAKKLAGSLSDAFAGAEAVDKRVDTIASLEKEADGSAFTYLLSPDPVPVGAGWRVLLASF